MFEKLFSKIKTLKYEFLVILFFVLSRIPSLGYEIFNTDVWKWKARIFNFGSGVFNLDFANTLQRYHPGVTLMWLGTIAVKLNSFYYKVILGLTPPDNDITTVFTLHFTQKFVIVIAIAVVLASVFYALRNLFSLKYALVFITILTFEPFYIALTRVVHLEGLLSTFMLASYVWFYYFLHKQDPFNFEFTKKTHLFISAFFAACAILTKTSSLFILGFIPLITFINFFLASDSILRSFKLSVKISLYWLLVVVLVFFILWPALWVDPIGVLMKLGEGIFDTGVVEGHEQFFFGMYVQDPGTIFYPIVFLFRSSPILLIGVFGSVLLGPDKFISSVSAIKNSSNKNSLTSSSVVWENPLHRRFFLYTLLFTLLYALEMTIPTKKLDRYLLPSIVFSTLLAASFYMWVFSRLNLAFYKKYLFLLFILIICTIRVHPDYFSYYNPLFGGLKTGIKVIEPKWLIGKNQIVAYFKSLLESGAYSSFAEGEAFDTLFANGDLENRLVIGFPEKYYTQIYPFIQEIGAWATIKDLTPHAKETIFFVYPVWEDDSAKEDRFKIEYVDSIYLRGVAIYNVYRRIP